MDLSIIIPVLEESKKIARDIEAASEFLMSNRLKGEIIIVDDGSRDKTCEVAEALKVPTEITLRVIRLDQHRGKGCAVRTGMKLSQGHYAMFADSGCCVPYNNVLNALTLLKNDNCDIAHGSRKLEHSRIHVPQVWYRRIYSMLFRWLIIVVMKVPSELTDTQCGFKIYRGDLARKLYGECVTDGFMFDVEILLRARRRRYHIKEFPVEWSADRDSRLAQTLSLKGLFTELMNIKQALGKSSKEASMNPCR
ncbi:MAG: glycosyltransferase [bacterium]